MRWDVHAPPLRRPQEKGHQEKGHQEKHSAPTPPPQHRHHLLQRLRPQQPQRTPREARPRRRGTGPTRRPGPPRQVEATVAATAARAQTTAACRCNRRTSSSAAGKARAGVEAKTVRVAKVMVASKGGQCLTQLKVKAMAKAKAKAHKHQCHKQMDKHHAPAPAPCSLAQLPCKLAVGHQSFMSKDFQSQVRWMHWPSSLHPHQILWVTSTRTQPSGCCERKPSLIMAEARRAKTVRVAKVMVAIQGCRRLTQLKAAASNHECECLAEDWPSLRMRSETNVPSGGRLSQTCADLIWIGHRKVVLLRTICSAHMRTCMYMCMHA